jgi:hypothetical protein
MILDRAKLSIENIIVESMQCTELRIPFQPTIISRKHKGPKKIA